MGTSVLPLQWIRQDAETPRLPGNRCTGRDPFSETFCDYYSTNMKGACLQAAITQFHTTGLFDPLEFDKVNLF